MVVLDTPAGVADQGEVGVVTLGLIDEALPLLAGHRGEGSVLHRGGPLPIALDHGVDVELGHGRDVIRIRYYWPTLSGLRRSGPRPCAPPRDARARCRCNRRRSWRRRSGDARRRHG